MYSFTAAALLYHVRIYVTHANTIFRTNSFVPVNCYKFLLYQLAIVDCFCCCSGRVHSGHKERTVDDHSAACGRPGLARRNRVLARLQPPLRQAWRLRALDACTAHATSYSHIRTTRLHRPNSRCGSYSFFLWLACCAFIHVAMFLCLGFRCTLYVVVYQVHANVRANRYYRGTTCS